MVRDLVVRTSRLLRLLQREPLAAGLCSMRVHLAPSAFLRRAAGHLIVSRELAQNVGIRLRQSEEPRNRTARSARHQGERMAGRNITSLVIPIRSVDRQVNRVPTSGCGRFKRMGGYRTGR